MKGVWVLSGLAVAVVSQALVARVTIGGTTPVDLVLVAVVSVALIQGSLAGMIAGTLGGLAQDALSAAVVGVGGLAKTIAGFAAGAVGARVLVATPLVRFLVFAGATGVHGLVFHGVYRLIDSPAPQVPFAALGWQALGNGAVGVGVFEVANRIPTLVARRRRRGRRR